jgi:hypothetical protein
MNMCRRFHGAPVVRLVISVETETTLAVDHLLDWRGPGRTHPARGCRSEFVRLAIEEKLARDRLRFESKT